MHQEIEISNCLLEAVLKNSYRIDRCEGKLLNYIQSYNLASENFCNYFRRTKCFKLIKVKYIAWIK